MDTPRPPGLLASARHLLDSGLQLVQVRLELLGTELEEQKLRVAQGLLLGMLGALSIALAFLLLCALVVVLFWDDHRIAALVTLAVLFGGGGALLVRAADRNLRTVGGMFGTTLQELSRDRDALAVQPEQAP